MNNDALKKLHILLDKNRERIIRANKIDLDNFKGKQNSPLYSRLKIDNSKIDDLLNGIKTLIKLDSKENTVVFKKKLKKDLYLEKVIVPIGKIGVIFESRPDALIQIGALMIKTSNKCILKGGSEAKNTNKYLFKLLLDATKKLGKNYFELVENRIQIKQMLSRDDIDLIIPRGSNKFVEYIKKNTMIPVLGHSEGICHIFIDKTADIKKCYPLVINAKLDYPSACNAVETLLIEDGVKIDFNVLKEAGIKIIKGKYDQEFSDNRLSVKTVKNIEEAITHINKYGSKHTDAILTNSKKNAELFKANVDSSSVYVNASTRFADGFRYGFGAEVGISTSKIHARGPVGIEGLMTYKYVLTGDYNLVE